MKSFKKVLLKGIVFAYILSILAFLIDSDVPFHIPYEFIYIFALFGGIGAITIFSFGRKQYQADKKSGKKIPWHNHITLQFSFFCLLQGIVVVTWIFNAVPLSKSLFFAENILGYTLIICLIINVVFITISLIVSKNVIAIEQKDHDI